MKSTKGASKPFPTKTESLNIHNTHGIHACVLFEGILPMRVTLSFFCGYPFLTFWCLKESQKKAPSKDGPFVPEGYQWTTLGGCWRTTPPCFCLLFWDVLVPPKKNNTHTHTHTHTHTRHAPNPSEQSMPGARACQLQAIALPGTAPGRDCGCAEGLTGPSPEQANTTRHLGSTNSDICSS